MSNSSVGTVYASIIDHVLDSARVDLEENGVDENILDELRKGWQKKLSQQQLAVFPWDPKPDPPAQTAPVPAVGQPGPLDTHTAATFAPPMPMNPGNPGLSFPQPPMKAEPGVKLEPGLEGTNAPLGAPNPNVQARVMQNLQAQYGARANATIGKLQDSMGQSGPLGQPRPQGDQQSAAFAYAGPHQQLDPMQQRPQPPPSQLDGSDDHGFEGILMRQSPSGQTTELGRVEIDRMLHTQIAAQAKAMEGGGLMLPLKRAGKRSAVASASTSRARGDETISGRFDGGDDDDVKSENDDEAINSDLDDPEDNVEEDEDEDDTAFTMLCMYDKVQRVKNKWKCVLKDGVLNVNGKDYVFHKATGEYEW